MPRYIWSHLNNQQIGKYAEYFVKMEFTMHGWQVYTTEVDDRGIDFVARREGGRFFEVQVKSIRDCNYIFLQKDKFSPREGLLAAVVVFTERLPPALYLIPSTAWLTTSALLCSRDYEGKKSKPEWGLNLSVKNQHLLDGYGFDRMIDSLTKASTPPA
jgi:hypothetical protein